jgi:hypothetical protein
MELVPIGPGPALHVAERVLDDQLSTASRAEELTGDPKVKGYRALRLVRRQAPSPIVEVAG